MTEKPEVTSPFSPEYAIVGCCSIDDNMASILCDLDIKAEEYQKMEYSPYDKAGINRDAKNASQAMQPHLHVINSLLPISKERYFKVTSY